MHLIISLNYCCVSPVVSNFISKKWRKLRTTGFTNNSDPTDHLETVPLQDIEAFTSANTPSPFATLIQNLTSSKATAATTEQEPPKLRRQHCKLTLGQGEC